MRSLLLPAIVLPIVLIILFSVNWVLGLVVLLIVIAGALLTRYKAIVAAFTWRRPHIEVDTEYFDLGSRPVITYRRSSRRPIDLDTCTFESRILCTERVWYGQGTERREAHRVVYDQKLFGEGSGTADGVEAQLELEISAHHGAPSMKLSDNAIEWEVKISIVDDGLPNDSHTFDLKVAPRLDSGLRPGVQDS